MNDARGERGRITARVILFTQEDAAMFIDMLDNPRAPNAALTKAYERYKNKVEKGTIRNRT